jgi:gamma-glutamyltranspeptidase/glutathione hydrolase
MRSTTTCGAYSSTLLLTVLLAARAAAQSGPIPTDSKDPLLNQGPKAEAIGEKVMVSTQLPVVTQGALRVLREGGNAVDAAVTAVFLQQVNDYHQVSLFGAMSGLYYEAASGKYYAFNAFSDRPDASRSSQGDPEKVAIGGTVRGLEALARRFGTRPWPSYLEPAIACAEEGVLVTSFMYRNNASLIEGGSLTGSAEARKFYLPDGHLVPVGFRWKMPALAETLRRVAAEGADYLYQGGWAQKFVKEAQKRGGRVSLEDLAEYQVRWLEPLRVTYRGQEIITEPPPNTGGMIVAYNLNILENFDLKSSGHYAESAETLEIMARAFGRVEDELEWALEDPLTFRVPTGLWLSKDYGRLGAQLVRETRILPGVSLGPSAEPATAEEPAAAPPDLGSNHNVIADGEGNWITFLHTGHGGTPGVFIDGVRATGSGVKARTRGPGRRILAAVTGVLVAKDGKPWLSLGTPGFPPQPVTEVLVNVLDFGMHPKEAADAPRFWAFLRREREVEIESRITEAVRKGMSAAGIKIKDLGEYNWHTGSMQIIWRDGATGKLHGVTDPRRLGLAAGF